MTTPPVRQILIFEYLHALPEMYANAPPSMRSEGRAMLLAASRDFADLPGVVVCLAACDSAAAGLPPISNVEVIVVDGDAEASLVDAILQDGPFDEIFPIAPESNRVFANLVQGFRDRGQSVLTPSADTIEIGSDKWRLFKLLEEHRISTIPTARVSNATSTETWQQVALKLKLSPDDECVIKPIDGAGCEEIERLAFGGVATRLLECHTEEKMIVQPFMAGESFSVGIIGRGMNLPPLVLPTAVQHIEWNNNSPTYHGGAIPAALTVEAQSQLDELLQRLLQVVAVNGGYVGVDFIRQARSQTRADARKRSVVDSRERSQDRQETGQKTPIRNTQQIDSEWVITEINPRLCTSYLGYRAATTMNLAGELLGIHSEEPVQWSPERTAFSCESGENRGYN